MRTTLCCLLLPGLGLVGVPAAPAQNTSEPAAPASAPSEKLGPEARTAFLRWQKARRDADLAYLAALRASLEKATRQSQLDQAVAIRAEIKRVADRMRDESAADSNAPLAEFLVGTSWVSDLNGAVVAFAKEGKGKRLHRGTEKELVYKLDSEKQFTIHWPAGTSTQGVLADDRKSFVAGGVTWKLKAEP